jgi:mannose-1-phosphate guanylyltransferase
MVASGHYLWNTGIFAWPNRKYAAELAAHAPEVARAVDLAIAARAAGKEAEFGRLYAEVPEMAVDHAVMERTSDLLVVPADFVWSDVGSWADLAEVLEPDAGGNVIRGDGLVSNGRGNLVFGSGRLVVLDGVDDLVVIDSGDALLVVSRDRAQDVKEIVSELKRRKRTDLL